MLALQAQWAMLPGNSRTRKMFFHVRLLPGGCYHMYGEERACREQQGQSNAWSVSIWLWQDLPAKGALFPHS